MSTSSFLRADGTLDARGRSRWTEWFPSLQQLSNALQLQFDTLRPVNDAGSLGPGSPLATTMRQGLGLICLLAMAAGFLPFLYNWVVAGRMGTALPLAELASLVQGRQGVTVTGPFGVLVDMGRTIAGLEPAFLPGWLAAGLSALGGWLNWPLHWLTAWIVYGLGVLLVAHLLGATATLQRFYAVTSYAAAPLLLLALGPIPCLGVLIKIAAYLWAFAVYVQAVRAVTRLSTGRVVLAVLMPGAFILIIGMIVTFSLLATTWDLLFQF